MCGRNQRTAETLEVEHAKQRGRGRKKCGSFAATALKSFAPERISALLHPITHNLTLPSTSVFETGL